VRLADNPRSLRLEMSRDDPRHHGRVLWSRLGSRCAARYTRFALSVAPYLGTLGEGTPCPTMNLSVRDAASLLKVSEKTIYRWIQQQVVPAYRVQEQYRFNRAELLEWATSRRLNVSSEIFLEPEAEGLPIPSLVAALEAGGVHYRVSGSDKAGALREVVQLLRLPDEVDREFLLRVLLAREAIAPTAIGDGIAIPHVRNPVVLHVGRPSITLCFLDQPIDYGALDGKPVHTLFTIISPTTRAHLHLMSRLAFVLRDAEVRCALERQESRPQLLREVARAEQQLAPSNTPCPPPVEVGASHAGSS
jgi:nitrogen PTS system EIIA component